MIKLDPNIITEKIKECKKELEDATEFFFKDNDQELITNEIRIFQDSEDIGIIYFILSNGEVKYIGKSKGKKFRQRMKSHFCDVGKGTQSKYNFIKRDERDEKKVSLKFILIQPESFRNLLEEELIKKYNDDDNDLWNYK